MAKANAKKPTKAQKAPKKQVKPLIDGKYSHKFLLRLEPEEGDYLERIKKALHTKTYSGTMVHLLLKFEELQKEVHDLRTIRYKLTNQVNDNNYKLENLAEALKAVLEGKLKDPDEITDPDEDPEDED